MRLVIQKVSSSNVKINNEVCFTALKKSEKSNLNIISQAKYNIQFDFQTQKPYTENIKRVPATSGMPLKSISVNRQP